MGVSEGEGVQFGIRGMSIFRLEERIPACLVLLSTAGGWLKITSLES